MKVLVVGDKPEERQIVVDVLGELGQQAEQAENGLAGWEAYRRGRFDIVISDFIMPGMNGLELCSKIRRQPREHYTYVLVCSLFSEKQHILAGFEAGVDLQQQTVRYARDHHHIRSGLKNLGEFFLLLLYLHFQQNPL